MPTQSRGHGTRRRSDAALYRGRKMSCVPCMLARNPLWRYSMTLDEFLAVIDDKQPPAPLDSLEQFESQIGHRLPEDYRRFLLRCNGGYAAGSVVFQGPTPEGNTADACPNHIGGFREEDYF